MAATAPMYYPPPPAKKLEDEAAADRQEEARANKCCCCHLTKGIWVIGALELLFLLAEFGGIIATYVLVETGVWSSSANGTHWNAIDGTNSDQQLLQELVPRAYGSSYADYNWIYARSPIATLCVGAGSAAVGIAIVILMLVGVRRSKPRLLIPHVIAQIFGILALFAGSAFFIYGSVTTSTSNVCSETRHGDACTKILLSYGAFIVVFTIFAGLEIYFLTVVIRCYRYLKEKCKRYSTTASPYYAIYQQQQRQYQQQLLQQQQHYHHQQLLQQQQEQQKQQQSQQSQQSNGNAQHQQSTSTPAYAHQQPIYATYAQPYGYSYGYRYV